MLEKIKNVKWGYVLLGILLGAAGICFTMFNDSLKILTMSIGVIVTVFGVMFGAVTIASKSRGPAFAFKILLALSCLAAGIVTMIFNKEAVDIIISLFSLLLIVDGSFKLNTSIMSKRYSVGGWWIMTAVSVAVIASAFILTRYTSKIDNATLWLGIIILIDAAANLFSTVWVSKYEIAAKAEIYYEVHKDIESKR